jgi:hypothetical protein
MISEKDIIDRLQQGQVQLGLLKLQLSALERRGLDGRKTDAVVSLCWNRLQEEFAVEIRAQSTPKILKQTIYGVKAAVRNTGMNPMIIVPYLNREALVELEREEVSGVDLCGNGVIIVPGKLYVERSDRRNQFPSSAPIKGVYRRKSSLVGRVFLARPRYQRIGDVVAEIDRRSMRGSAQERAITFATVSKVLRALEDDLIVGREGASLRLLQADKLLEKLSMNYVPPKPVDVVSWRIPTEPAGPSIEEILRKAFQNPIPAVVTGASSVSMYAVMQRSSTISIYCPDPGNWLANVPGSQTDRFPTISVIRTDDASVYFDARRESGIAWASPVQTYLELSAGDKRDKETAAQVRESILGGAREDGV